MSQTTQFTSPLSHKTPPLSNINMQLAHYYIHVLWNLRPGYIALCWCSVRTGSSMVQQIMAVTLWLKNRTLLSLTVAFKNVSSKWQFITPIRIDYLWCFRALLLIKEVFFMRIFFFIIGISNMFIYVYKQPNIHTHTTTTTTTYTYIYNVNNIIYNVNNIISMG